jgi:peptidoglycan/LPS O-acetylase OafA/YrhL
VAETAIDQRPKFEFADGLRALAALSVALLHATLFTGYLGDAELNAPIAWRVAQIGYYGVPIFIVLSGFVLMLPVARTAGLELRGGFWGFIGRRARRILPPYYASLLLFLALILLIPLMQDPSGTAWVGKVPVTPGGLISHVLLVHNLSAEWVFQINGPAWSIATEWQIYFLMPLVLLPLWRRLGPWWTVAIALPPGFLLTYLFPRLAPAHFWYIGLFALGMLAAYLAVRGTRFKPAWPAAIVTVVALAWLWIFPASAQAHNRWSETLAGIAAALVLVWLANASLGGRTTWLHRILETRILVWVGLWSYSLYLIHSPLLALANLLLLPLELPTWTHLAIMWLVAIPVAAGVAYLFHRLVERRFATSHQSAEVQRKTQRPDSP